MTRKRLVKVSTTMERISKDELVRRLEARVTCAAGGEAGLNILIHGWLKYRKYGCRYRDKLYHRDWFYISEVLDLSDYAQIDLTQ